ncbi:O-antigen ligase family protein [Candidatus Deianiraea vastatrix]|uniref:O-Antigen ligase family protein n=1 Tax=Candidatus Deianiraea vastatrix TaxID=2163644 RepID=A0A5B8XF09_9RICK|nr:O-antigen ligase family protein [Candidatus Deianiraea vastatrix]QED23863.1 Putative O-Antigen ligase family protein [Candidatus Deianiraea vastatrix]
MKKIIKFTIKLIAFIKKNIDMIEKIAFFCLGIAIMFNVRMCNLVFLSYAIIAVYVIFYNRENEVMRYALWTATSRPIMEQDSKVAAFKAKIFEAILLSAFAVIPSPNFKYSFTSLITILIMIFFAIFVASGYCLQKKVVKYFFSSMFAVISSIAIYYYNGNHFEINGKSLGIITSLYYIFLHRDDVFTVQKIKKIRYLIYLLLYCLIGFVIFKNHSATSKLVFISSPFVYFLFSKLSIKISKIILFFATILIVSSVILFYYFVDIHTVFKKFGTIPPSFKHRMCIAKYSMEKFTENPFTGNGFKSSRFYNTSKDCFIVKKGETINDKIVNEDFAIPYNAGFHSHNLIIQILFEFGVFGIIVFVFLMIRLIQQINPSQTPKTFALKFTVFYNIFMLYFFSYSLWEGWIISVIVIFFLLYKKNHWNILEYKKIYPTTDKSMFYNHDYYQ